MIRVILLLAVFICSSTGGEIAITYGMKDVGEPERLREDDDPHCLPTAQADRLCGLELTAGDAL